MSIEHRTPGFMRAAVVLWALAAVALFSGCGSGRSGSADLGPADLTAGSARVVLRMPQQITGVAVSRSGRIFVSSPRWHTDGPLLSVVERRLDGSFRPYPDSAMNAWTPQSPAADAGQKFVCVQSVHIDGADRLWVLDPGSPRLAGVLPGAAKLIEFDLATDRIVRTIRFDERAAPADSYLNDVRVDVRTQTAFITDSGRGGIVVVDLSTNTARRVLDRHESTLAEKDFVPVIGGRELRFTGGPLAGQVPQIHSDGLALDARGDYLYWQALTGRTLYRCRTAALRSSDGRPERLAQSVERLGTTVVTDGMEMDAAGNIYFSALEEDAVIVRRPDGSLQTLARGPALGWPDSFALRARAGGRPELYVSVAQIHRTAWFSADPVRVDGAGPEVGYAVLKLRP